MRPGEARRQSAPTVRQHLYLTCIVMCTVVQTLNVGCFSAGAFGVNVPFCSAQCVRADPQDGPCARGNARGRFPESAAGHR